MRKTTNNKQQTLIQTNLSFTNFFQNQPWTSISLHHCALFSYLSSHQNNRAFIHNGMFLAARLLFFTRDLMAE
jgi:hypothetical protein